MTAVARRAPRPKPVYDAERLEKQTYLDSGEAAFYLRFTPETHANPRKAFMAAVDRLGPEQLPRCRFGHKVLFRRRDLDRLLQLATGAADQRHGESR